MQLCSMQVVLDIFFFELDILCVIIILILKHLSVLIFVNLWSMHSILDIILYIISIYYTLSLISYQFLRSSHGL